jgi:putative SOS response-associated peptidase YedK
MCGTLKSSGIIMKPGDMMPFWAQRGMMQFAQWGIEQAYNARLENLYSTWEPIAQYRCFVKAQWFMDGGEAFKCVGQEHTALAALHNMQGGLVVLTCPAVEPILSRHLRMPLVLPNDSDIDRWLEQGAQEGYHMPVLEIVSPT